MGLGTAAVGIRESASSSIRRYFDAAADRLGLHPEMRRLLSVPFREMTVEMPLRRDDDRLQLFRGYRVQHNGVRGPLLGAVRCASGIELDTLRAAAESMTWRCAVANVPFGGSAGAVACDPEQLSRREFERIIRRYTGRIHHVLGRYQDVSLPGAGVRQEAMSWIDAEYASLHEKSAGVTTGKPAGCGGLPERDLAVARALAALILRVAHDHGKSISGLRVAIQAVDRSGAETALALAKAGCLVVALSEERGAWQSSTGIDVPELVRDLQRGRIPSAPKSASEICSADCDVLTISAPECVLDRAAARQVHASIVVETSELVISPSGESVLAGRGTAVIPDLVGAASAVITANMEWASEVQKSLPDGPTVERELESQLLRLYEQVLDRSKREEISLRTAAYAAAIERVARSERLRVA